MKAAPAMRRELGRFAGPIRRRRKDWDGRQPFDLPPGTDMAWLRAEIADRNWYHRFPFGEGLITPGNDPTHLKAPWILRADLEGRRVLDIGAFDGYFSFEAERRGATDVLATDAWSWNWPGSDARRNFELIRSVLDSGVRDQTISVEDVSPEVIGGPFDVVFFLGVLYHAPDPLGYLQRVRSVTGGSCVVETLVDLLEVPVPALAYYEGATLYGDASNNFGPNRLAV